MKVQRVRLDANYYSWLVLGDDHLPIKPIFKFIQYLNNTEKSLNTVRSYANHLMLYWRYLSQENKNWRTVTIDDFSRFVAWLRQYPKQKREPTTINSMLGALSSFYRYHNQLGNTDIRLTESSKFASSRYKSLLYHVFKNYPAQKRVISLKQPKTLLKTLTHAQVVELLSTCANNRDRFLVALLHETGLRIGQALALRHNDIKSWDNIIHVLYRSHNINGVQNKTLHPNIIHVSSELMQLYADYLLTCSEEPCEYVFTCLRSNTPLTYTAVRQIFARLSKKSGIKVKPHMLRHTHATDLIRHGWDPTLVQKRLGHRHVQTTLSVYSHVDQKDMKHAFKRYLASKENKS